MLRMYKKVLIPLGLVLGLFIGVYFVYFHRPPADDILAANRKQRNSADTPWSSNLKDSSKTDDYYEYDDEDEDADYDELEGLEPEEAAKVSYLKWERFMKKNDYVSIGDLYDKCDGENKVTLGKVVLLPDKENGGITSKTFLNVNLEKDVTGGEMYIECAYNGKDLYSNHWDLCTVEEAMPDRIIYCPLKEGLQKFVKDLKIPNYLPKGRYTTKAWLTNQDDHIIGCSFADFTI